jgi:DNA repair protein RecO (recombination protein O)
MAITLAYVLHTRPWRETSLLADALSQDFGRITLIVKGAKRPHSPLRGLLEPFTPVRIHFTGKLGIKQMTQAHWVQALNPVHPAHAVPAWYLNELCLHTLGEDDPCPALFSAYHHAIQALAALPIEDDAQTVLRQFEYQLLSALGLWPDARRDATGQPLLASQLYTLDEAAGWRMASNDALPWALQGAQLLALAGLSDAEPPHEPHPIHRPHNSKQALRLAMRSMLVRALHGKTLTTRRVWQELDAI